MKSLVSLDKNNHAFTTTLIIADGVEIEHRAVMKLLETHIKRRTFIALEVRIKKAKKAGKPTRFYDLTEKQATFLITLMKNRDVVLDFKESLVDEFTRMKNELARIASQQTNQQWIEARNAGKIERRAETDVIKEFVDYATEQGSKSAGMYYMNISKMENKALFIVEQKYKNLRDVLGLADLSTLQNADHIVSRALRHGMDDKLHYKDIYKLAKERVEIFAELRGKSPILTLAGQNNGNT